MPIERSQINAVLRTVSVEYFGNQMSVTYRPDAMSPAKSAEMARQQQEASAARNGDGNDFTRAADDGALLAEQLSQVLTSWDVLEEGEPLPPTAENLKTFPYAFLAAIYQSINDDLAPKARTTRR